MSEEIEKDSNTTTTLKEISILIIDVIKEFIILFVVILVTLNYYIHVDNRETGECKPPTENSNANNSETPSTELVGIWDALEDITKHNLEKIRDFLKNCMSHNRFFIFLIGPMYYFFYVIKTPKILSLTNQTFDTNVKFIFQDLWNKLNFILLFPTLFISTISLIYICFRIMFKLPIVAPEYGFLINLPTKIFMFILFFSLFYTIGRTLYYLLIRGNISDLHYITPSDYYHYSVSFLLIMLLIFVGFNKILIFNFRSTFIPNLTEIKNKIFSKDKEILFSLYVSIIILFITLSINIKHLFSFELWIFSVILVFILFILLSTSYFFGESFSLKFLSQNN